MSVCGRASRRFAVLFGILLLCGLGALSAVVAHQQNEHESQKSTRDYPSYEKSDVDTFLHEQLALRGITDAQTRAWSSQEDLDKAAREVLESYKDSCESRFITGGYLDLQGRLWGCVIQGATGWVDVVFIKQESHNQETMIRIVRLGGEGENGEKETAS